MKVATLTCQRCGHKWTRRKDTEPEQCPKCKSPYWRKPRRNHARG